MSWLNYPFYTLNNALPKSNLDDLLFKGQGLPKEDASAGAYANGAPVTRNSKVAYLNLVEFANVYDLCNNIIKETNNLIFALDLDSLEPLQFTEYSADYSGEYGWHTDVGYDVNVNRKLSFVLHLSYEGDYDGGNLEFFDGSGTPISIPKTQGSMVIFPSVMYHRIAPVTRGTGYSLCGWLTGPRFK